MLYSCTFHYYHKLSLMFEKVWLSLQRKHNQNKMFKVTNQFLIVFSFELRMSISGQSIFWEHCCKVFNSHFQIFHSSISLKIIQNLYLRKTFTLSSSNTFRNCRTSSWNRTLTTFNQSKTTQNLQVGQNNLIWFRTPLFIHWC